MGFMPLDSGVSMHYIGQHYFKLNSIIMKKKKRFSINPEDKETARKSLDEIAKDSNKVIGENINGGWLEKIAPGLRDELEKP